MSNETPRLDPKSMPLQGNVVWQKEKHFLGTAPSGKQVDIDANKEAGASPMELILLGLPINIVSVSIILLKLSLTSPNSSLFLFFILVVKSPCSIFFIAART